MSGQLITQQGEQIQIRSGGIQIQSVGDLMEWCRIVANSKLAPRDLQTPEAIFVAVQMGTEIGLTPTQALQSIAVINGRPSVWGDAALALVKAHPECEDVVESFEKDGEEGVTAVCEVLRRGKVPVKRKFTMAMARKAGLSDKSGPWKQYPTRMLQMRARSWAIRDAFPDALKGVRIAEEVRDYQPEKPAVAKEVKLILPDEEPETVEPEPAATEEMNEKGEFAWTT